MIAIIVGALVAIVLVLALIGIFNTLIAKRQKVNNAWADIDVWLKRRAEIIPSLVETVKAYAAYEAKLLEDLTSRRTQTLVPSTDLSDRIQAEENLSPPLGRILLMAEDYPDLKASENFLKLQEALSECEEKIEMARRYYNGAVKEYNIFAGMFPISIIANMSRFKMARYFDPSRSKT